MTGPDRELAPDRTSWALRRARWEAGDEKHCPDGKRHYRHWSLLKLVLGVFGIGLRAIGLYARGVRNALDIRVNAFEIALDGLPAAFDGYRILQLSDLHVDALPEMPEAIARAVHGIDADLCVLTGDYRFRVHGTAETVAPGMARLSKALRTRDGIFAVLGNHDSADMAPLFEGLGIRMLVNETATLVRGPETLHITGVDDVHYYYSEDASVALRYAPDGCRIVLVHSPEFAEQAAESGVALYLTGHTHAGQVCLPGGLPVITHSRGRRKLAVGLWRVGSMIGYTSRGAGVSGLPVRFNCRGEAALITLRRA